MEKDIAVVYMVAGISSRFDGKIKQFAKVTETETLIEYSLNQALPAGFTKIVFIVGEKTEKPFREKFGNNYKGIPIYYAIQKFDSKERDKPWGTVDALCSAKDLLNCPFVLCNGDDIYGENTFKTLVEHLKNKNALASAGYKLKEVLSEKGSVNRGIFKLKEKNVESIREIFDITKENLFLKGLCEEDLCAMNLFALSPNLIDTLEKDLIEFKNKYKDDRRAEYLLTHGLNNLIKQEKIAMEVYVAPDKWFGVTNPGDELIIQEQLKLTKKKSQHKNKSNEPAFPIG